MIQIDIPDNLPEWIDTHARRYIDSDGRDGHMWDSSVVGGPGPVPTLLLVTTGRRSGKQCLAPLIYGKTDGGYAIVASKGGAPQHPAWYLNLVAKPEAVVQVMADRLQVTPRVASGAERAALWEQMVGIYSPYTDYQKKTDREIPIVVLEPVAG